MKINLLTKEDISIISLLKQFTNQDISISTPDFKSFVDNLNTNHQIYVGKINNQIVACGTLIIEQKIIHNLGKVGHIEDIVVDNAYQGSGLGKQIIKFLVEQAKLNNCYKVILDCSEKNINFYQKFGFSKKENHMALYF